MKLSEWRAASRLPVHERDLLIECVLGLDKLHIFLNAASLVLPEEAAEALHRLESRRLSGEPLQYLMGYAYFMGQRFAVCPGVLIPRPDTEVLANAALRQIRSRNSRECRVLDLCTGSGCVGISILREAAPEHRVSLTLADISAQALAVAKENCAALIKDGSAVSFVASDYLKAFPTQRFDVIVSNPPYIRQAEMNTLDPEVRSYEPRLALDGGTDGLDAYRRIASEIRPVLEADGHLFLEVGYDQAEEVAKLFAPHFTQTEIIKDLNAIARVVHLYNV